MVDSGHWESQSKTTPQSPEDGHVYCILLTRIAFCHVSENLPLHCLFKVYVTMSNYVCFLSWYCTWRHHGFAYVCWRCITVPTYFHIHIQRHTHTQAHMYNQHTRGIVTTRHRSLVERGRRKAFVIDKGLAHKQKQYQNQTDIHESKEKDSST